MTPERIAWLQAGGDPLDIASDALQAAWLDLRARFIRDDLLTGSQLRRRMTQVADLQMRLQEVMSALVHTLPGEGT